MLAEDIYGFEKTASRQLLDINHVVFNYIRHAFDVPPDNFIGLAVPGIKDLCLISLIYSFIIKPIFIPNILNYSNDFNIHRKMIIHMYTIDFCMLHKKVKKKKLAKFIYNFFSQWGTSGLNEMIKLPRDSYR